MWRSVPGLSSALSPKLLTSFRGQRRGPDISILSMFYSGLIISGGSPADSVGQSVEVYVPSTGQHCNLADLPDKRYFHSMEKMVVCGGSEALTSCLTLTDAGWEVTTTLLERR